jgi:hypothetical protein
MKLSIKKVTILQLLAIFSIIAFWLPIRLFDVSIYILDIIIILTFISILFIPSENWNIKSITKVSKYYIYVIIAFVFSLVLFIAESRSINQITYVTQSILILFTVIVVQTLANSNYLIYRSILKYSSLMGLFLLLMYILWILNMSEIFVHLTRDQCSTCPGMYYADPRMFFGVYTPNETGRYLLFLIFCLTEWKKKEISRYIHVITIPAGLLSASKTTIIQVVFYYALKRPILLLSLTAFLILIFVNIFDINVIDKLRFFLDDFSAKRSSNSNRLEQYKEVLNNWPQYIYNPYFGSSGNTSLSSVHNGYLSIIVNYGLITFLILFISILYLLVKNFKKIDKNILFFLVLDSIIYMFNPFLLGRHQFIPLAVYLSQVIRK